MHFLLLLGLKFWIVYYINMINLKFLLMLHSICNSMKDQLMSEDEVTYETQNHVHSARCIVLSYQLKLTAARLKNGTAH